VRLQELTLTGKYQQRFGFDNGTGFGDSGDIGLSNDVVTMADVFQKTIIKPSPLANGI
jgi:hypothetical protein